MHAAGSTSERGETLNLLLLLHDRLSVTTVLFMLAVGIWGLVSFARGGTLSGSLAGTLAIGQALVTVQVLAGVALVAEGLRPPDPTHYLYGATAILTLPFIWSWAKTRDARQALMFYTLASLFIFGLAVRGITTGHEAPVSFPAQNSAVASPEP